MSQGSQSVDKSAIQLWKRSLCFHLFPVHLHSQIFNFSSAEPKLLADNANVWISKSEITSFCHKPEGRGPFRIKALRGNNCSAPPASSARKFPFNKTSTSWFCFFLGSLLSEIRTFHPSISTSARSRQTRLRTFSLCSDQLFLGFGIAAAAGSCAGTHRLHKQPIYSLFGNTRVWKEANREMDSVCKLQSRADWHK